MIIDCQSTESTLASLAGICQRSPAATFEALQFADPTPTLEHPEVATAGPSAFLASLEVTQLSIHGSMYFHGTRATSLDSFYSDGILPTARALEGIWTTLAALAANHGNDRDRISELRQQLESKSHVRGSWQFRHKVSNPRINGGPFGHLIRDQHRPSPGRHDYLAVPEIVQDIAQCIEIDLERLFAESTKPYIVKFATQEQDPRIVEPIFWHLREELCNEVPSMNSYCAFSGNGFSIPPRDIVKIEDMSAGW